MSSKHGAELTLIYKVRKLYDTIVFQASQASKESGIEIPRSLLISMICVESAGDKYATRAEKHYRDAILRNEKCPPADKLLNAYCSHSLFQIMGVHSKEYEFLGKLYTQSGALLIKCGTLPFTINEIYDRPAIVAARFLILNAEEYLKKKDYESVARIYNGGHPKANYPVTQNYVKKLALYMNLTENSYKKHPSI